MDFEEYLRKICFEQNPEILDDNMPEFFESWLSCFDYEDLKKFAEDYKIETDSNEEIEDLINYLNN
jgi:hypothetical protein